MTSVIMRRRSSLSADMIRKQMWKILQDQSSAPHGAGFVVPWYQVEDYMHMESSLNTDGGEEDELPDIPVVRGSGSRIELTQEELDAIYVRTPDPVKKERSQRAVTVYGQDEKRGRSRSGNSPRCFGCRTFCPGRREYAGAERPARKKEGEPGGVSSG